jgi:AcrR family transcriptional regulator
MASSSPPFSEPVRERRDAAVHRQQVLEAARRLFAERGVDDVTMDEIAQAAGVGKGTLYRRYADKGELVLALMNESATPLEADLRQLVGPAPEAGASALEHLEAVLIRLSDWIDEHAAHLAVVYHSPCSPERATRLHNSPLYRWLHGVVVDLLQRAVAQGESDVTDPVYVADALLGALHVDLYLFQRHERQYDRARIHAGLHQLVNGLRTR